jgi:hypothetical protein
MVKALLKKVLIMNRDAQRATAVGSNDSEEVKGPADWGRSKKAVRDLANNHR